MSFKDTVKLAKKYDVRYIQRMKGNTLFDVHSYNAGLLDYEDVHADDWCIPDQERISYFDKTGRLTTPWS